MHSTERVGGEPDEGAATIAGIGNPCDQPRVAKTADEADGAAQRGIRRDTERAGRQLLAAAFVNEQVDQQVPCRLAEELPGADDLTAEQAAALRPQCIAKSPCVVRFGAGPIASQRRALRSRYMILFVLPDNMVGSSTGDDDVIHNLNLERAPDQRELPGHRNIFRARTGVAARVVVDEQNTRRIEFERAPEQGAWIKGQNGEAAPLQLLVGDQPAGSIEKQYAQCLVGKRTHRHDEIAAKSGIERVDPPRADVGSQSLLHHVAGGAQEIAGAPAGDRLQSFGRLLQYPAETAEFLEQFRC